MNNSYIYIIKSNNENITDVYVGSTTNFKRRYNEHKCYCNKVEGRKYNLHLYKFIRDNGGWDNFTMEIIETLDNQDKTELRMKEQHYYNTLNSTLNQLSPYTTEEERIKNRNIKSMEYYYSNKQKCLEKNRKWRENQKLNNQDNTNLPYTF